MAAAKGLLALRTGGYWRRDVEYAVENRWGAVLASQGDDPLSEAGARHGDVRLCCGFGPDVVDLVCGRDTFVAWEDGRADLLALEAERHDPQRFTRTCAGFIRAWESMGSGPYRPPVPSLVLSPTDFRRASGAEMPVKGVMSKAMASRSIAFDAFIVRGHVWQTDEGAWGDLWQAKRLDCDDPIGELSLNPNGERDDEWGRAIDLMNDGLSVFLPTLRQKERAKAAEKDGPESGLIGHEER